MLEFIRYFAFSALEGISIYFIMTSVFRLKPFKHFKKFAPVLSIMVLQSFILREELYYPALVPIINLILFVLFFGMFLKIPLVWSFIVTIVGYTTFVLIQWGLLSLLFGDVASMEAVSYGGILLQSVTALVLLSIALYLNHKHIGFIANFDSLRLKSERYIMLGMIVATMVSLTIGIIHNIWLLLIVGLFLYFLYFAIKKEREQ